MRNFPYKRGRRPQWRLNIRVTREDIPPRPNISLSCAGYPIEIVENEMSKWLKPSALCQNLPEPENGP